MPGFRTRCAGVEFYSSMEVAMHHAAENFNEAKVRKKDKKDKKERKDRKGKTRKTRGKEIIGFHLPAVQAPIELLGI